MKFKEFYESLDCIKWSYKGGVQNSDRKWQVLLYNGALICLFVRDAFLSSIIFDVLLMSSSVRNKHSPGSHGKPRSG